MKQLRLFSVCLLAMVFSVARAYDFAVDGIYYLAYGTEVTVTHGENSYSGEVVIPSSVTCDEKTYQVNCIGSSAFMRCTALTAVTIPESVLYISDDAFKGCTGLKTVGILANVQWCAGSAFEGCNNISGIYLDSDFSPSPLTFYCGNSLTSVVLGNHVTTLGESAFSDCKNLSSVIFNEGLTSIGTQAFLNCTALTTVILPEGVTSIGRQSFKGCTSLTTLSVPNSLEACSSDAFNGCSSISTLYWDSDLSAQSLTSYCRKALTTVVLGKKMTTIGEGSFRECSALASITIPSNVTSIGDVAFNACTMLTELTLPAGLCSIGYGSLANCSKLKDLYVEAVNPPATGSGYSGTSDIVQSYEYESKTLHVPYESVAAYKNHEIWQLFGHIVGYETSLAPLSTEDNGLAATYDLSGKPISSLHGQKGVFIVNGQKVMIK